MDQASHYPLGSTSWEALPSLDSFKLPEASGTGASRSPNSILRNALEAEGQTPAVPFLLWDSQVLQEGRGATGLEKLKPSGPGRGLLEGRDGKGKTRMLDEKAVEFYARQQEGT